MTGFGDDFFRYGNGGGLGDGGYVDDEPPKRFTIGYTYDGAGNRLTMSDNRATPAGMGVTF